MATQHAPLSRVFALPLRLGRGTDNEAPIFDRHGELRAECVDDDCVERASALIRAANCHDDMLAALKELRVALPVISLADPKVQAADDKARAAIAKAEGRS